MKKKNSFVKKFIKKNNKAHESYGRIVAGGHNASDAEFLSGNKAVMQKLQHKMA